MDNTNTIFLKPKQLMFLEEISYQGAIKKIGTIKENLLLFYPNGYELSHLQSKTEISSTIYAKYYGIDLGDLQDAIKAKRLHLVKPSDLIFLEGAKIIQTASYRYKKYLHKLGKTFDSTRLSINEYAGLNNIPVDDLLIRFLEKQAEELLEQMAYEAQAPRPWQKGQ